jgi:hypothetical protein
VNEDQITKPSPAKPFILEDWEIISLSDPTGALKLCLVGHAFGNALPLGGENVRTSAIARYHMDGNRMVIFTRSGSAYRLGMRNAPQEQDKQRLIRYLDQISSIGNTEFVQSVSDTQTNILANQGSRKWDEKGGFAG